MIFCYLLKAVTFCKLNIIYAFPTLVSESHMQFHCIKKIIQCRFNTGKLNITFNVLASWFLPSSFWKDIKSLSYMQYSASKTHCKTVTQNFFGNILLTSTAVSNSHQSCIINVNISLPAA